MIFFWFYWSVTFEKKIFAATVFVALIPSSQVTSIFMEGIGLRIPKPMPFGAPVIVKLLPNAKSRLRSREFFWFYEQTARNGDVAGDICCVSFSDVFNGHGEAFSASNTNRQCWFWIADGRCFHIPPVVSSILKVPAQPILPSTHAVPKS